MLRQLKSKIINYLDDRKLKSILKEEDYAKRFERIYRENYWGPVFGSAQSKSGYGSTLESTQALRDAIKETLDRYKVSSILDIPCGDFYWMSNIDLSDIAYHGADIVKDVVQSNTERFASSSIRFSPMDLMSAVLPSVDLILTRDCLVHLSYDNIFSALKNIVRSKSTYFLTTTFLEAQNKDIETGQWRAINLEKEPFLLPPPIEYVKDTGLGVMGDKKVLGLWRLSDLNVRL